MTNLTESQARNLARLHEVGGTFTYSGISRVLAPRLQYKYERKQGFRTTYSEKGSHKGFHRTALESLVAKGLVQCTAREIGEYGNGIRTKADIGKVFGTEYIYTLPAPKAPKATKSNTWTARLAEVLTDADSVTITAAEMAAMGWPASAAKHGAYWGHNPAGRAARAAGFTPSLRTVDGSKVLTLTRAA